MIIVAPGLPETLTFISVAPPPPSPSIAQAFDPVISIPANLTNKFISITGSGSILLPGGNSGTGAINIGLQAQVLTGPGLIGNGTLFAFDTPKVIPWSFRANVFCDNPSQSILDVNVPNAPFIPGSVPQNSGAVVGSEAYPQSPGDASSKRQGSKNAIVYAYKLVAPLDFTQPIPLAVLVQIFNFGSTNLPVPISVTLSDFRLEY